MSKKQFEKVVSPVVTAAYAWLSKPDEGQQYSDGKYKVTLVLDKDDDVTQTFIDQLTEKSDAAATAEWGKVPKNLRYPFVDGDDGEKEEFTGKFKITAKSKFKPGCVDSAKSALPEGQEPRSGDLIRASLVLIPYKASGTPGVTCQLRNIQLVEKRNGGSGGGDDFDIVEGGFIANESGDVDDGEDGDF
jgi:hypothetical protein